MKHEPPRKPPAIDSLNQSESLAERLSAAETGRQRAELELHAVRELNRGILETVPGGVVRVEPSGEISYANPEAQRILGLRPDEISGRLVSDWHAHTIREDGSPFPVEEYPVTRCLAEGRSQPPATIGILRPDATCTWAVFTAAPLRDANGDSFSGAVVTFLEITERMQVQQRLCESEDRYRRLVENAPDAIVVHCQGKIVFVNPAAVRLWGAQSAEQLLGRQQLDLVHPDSRLGVAERMRRVAEEGLTTTPVEQRHLRLDGQPISVEASGSSCMYQGQPCIQVVIRDISERKLAESALLRANADLERRVQLRTQELLRKNDELELEVQERRRAEIELQNNHRFLERMLHLHERERQLIAYEIHDTFVQDVIAALMFCDSFRVRAVLDDESHWEMVDRVRSLLRGAIDEARRTISGLRPPIIDEQGIVAAVEFLLSEFEQRGLAVEFSAGADIPRFPSLLEGCVFRIVQEALNNLLRHSGVTRGKVRLDRRADRLHLEIQDHGVGFDPRRLPEGRFGLQGMRERARLIGGHIQLDSAPGRGTCIRLEMPLVPLDEANED